MRSELRRAIVSRQMCWVVETAHAVLGLSIARTYRAQRVVRSTSTKLGQELHEGVRTLICVREGQSVSRIRKNLHAGMF